MHGALPSLMVSREICSTGGGTVGWADNVTTQPANTNDSKMGLIVLAPLQGFDFLPIRQQEEVPSAYQIPPGSDRKF